MNIAVIGGGVAGVVSAYLLQESHKVVLFEQGSRLGGHTNTVVIPDGPDAGTPVDTGFIVLNDKNYPFLHQFLNHLQVPVRWSDMSFSYYGEKAGLQYAGTTINGLFAQRSNLCNRQFWRFLLDLAGFCRAARADLRQGVGPGTLGAYLDDRKVSPYCIEHYVLPMGAAIWSSSIDDMLAFPAEMFLRFFENHGLLGFRDRPRWQTVVGGSHSYLKRFQETFTGDIRTSSGVQRVLRTERGVTLSLADGGVEQFDAVVLAVHADQALQMLADPTEEEQRALEPWRYQKNHITLHCDTSVLPPSRRAWASWNYLRPKQRLATAPVLVSYHMNRLQGLKSQQEYCVTLNGRDAVADHLCVYETEFEHPLFTEEAVRTHERLPLLNGKRNSYFCGSYFGNGFHEDAVRSAVAVAGKLGAGFSRQQAAGSNNSRRAAHHVG